MSVVVELQANIQWEARPSTTSKRWVGVCGPINISMEADTLDELQGLINETMQLLLTDLLHDAELDQFLREHGWTARNLSSVQDDDDVTFDVPWDLVAKSNAIDSERRSH